MKSGYLLSFGIVAAMSCATAAPQALSDDYSRRYLASYDSSLDGENSEFKALPKPFSFPDNVRPTEVYGIDVSHFDGVIDWSKITGKKISFVYVKATQGDSYFDPTFQTNWQSLGNAPDRSDAILRGAYHFFVPGSGTSQGQNFISMVGKLNKNDLPPCLDMEWYFTRDPVTKKLKVDDNGQPIDIWSQYSAQQIVSMAKDWLAYVERKTGKRPIIYTSANWWKQRVGNDPSLAGYKFWVADYGKKSLETEKPRSPVGAGSPLWQFTENGSVENKKGVDVNVFYGDSRAFRAAMGIAQN